jgi:esterase/lipase
MNIPQASEIQSAIKIDCIFSEIINMDNLMRIDIDKINIIDLIFMIEKAQVLYQQIRNAKNKFFIFRDSNHTIDLFVKNLENKIKIINNFCNIFSIIIYFK